MYASIVRTVVPLVVAVVLGQAARAGLDLDDQAVTSIVTVVVGYLYYQVVRLVEQRVPAVGRWLLALGLTSATNPVYSRVSVPGKKLPRI